MGRGALRYLENCSSIFRNAPALTINYLVIFLLYG